MAHAVSPSAKPITAGQAGKFADMFVVALVKSGLPSIQTQQVLEQQGSKLLAQFISLVRAGVDAISEFVYRTVPVDRTMSPVAALAATGRTQYVSADVVASMSQGVGDTADIIWVPLKKWTSNQVVVDTLLCEYDLVPVDPFALAAHNTLEPDFAKNYSNFTLWQDAGGNWCYAAFDAWVGVRLVNVHRDDNDWDDEWWVAAVRKSALSSGAKV